MPTILVDVKGIEGLAEDFEKASDLLLRRVTLKGEYLVKEEVPKVTHNLELGISSDVDGNEGVIIASARTGREDAASGIVHYPSGKTKPVSLRPRPAFNYAEVVAKGRPAIQPKNAKVLIVPGKQTEGESYLVAGGKTYLFRRSVGATEPNPYDQRAMARLEKEIEPIANKLFEELFD